MSYNITNFDLIECGLCISKADLKEALRGYDRVEIESDFDSFSVSLGNGYINGQILEHGNLFINEVSFTYDGSRHDFDFFERAILPLTKGKFHAKLIWEGGDDTSEEYWQDGKKLTEENIKQQKVDKIVQIITQKFRTFGGGRTSKLNPIVNALSNEAPSFAAGVDVREVVETVVWELNK